MKPNKLTYINDKFTKEDAEKLKLQPLGENILKFRKKLYKKFDSHDLQILNNNLKNIKIKVNYFTPKMIFLKFASGSYNIKKNRIKILKYFIKHSFNHELFHVASSKTIGNYIFSGFMLADIKNKKVIGIGLNEGYTEYLANKHFKNNNEYNSYSYKICEFFSKKLEEIIGEKRMQSLYLNADLNGLTNYLCNFDEIDNIINFLDTLDYLIKHASLLKNNSLENKYKLVQCYLYKWFLKSKELDFKNNIITKEQFTNDLKQFIKSMSSNDLELDNYIKEKEYCLIK